MSGAGPHVPTNNDRSSRAPGRGLGDHGRALGRAGHRVRLAAGRAGGRLRGGRARRPAVRAVRAAVPLPRPPAARPTHRAGGRGPAPLRAGCRAGLRGDRHRRLPHRRDRRRRPGHRGGAGRRVPQRRLRPLPGLRDVPDPAAPPQPTFHTQGSPRMSRSDVLVSAEWAEANLDTPGVVFVEVDEDVSAYDKGHIRGAVKLDWKTELQDPVRRDFVNKEQFEELLSRKGIGNDDTVVLYGGNNNWFAAYAYWYFRLYGHQDVKLLDGGRKRWELDSRELSTDAVQRPATTYKAQEQDTSIRAFRDEVVNAIGASNLVDVRSPDEYTGKLLAPAHLPQEQSQRPGHIPTALNGPWSKAANEDGTFRSDDELRELYGEAGLDDAKPTIAYCRIGERSSHTWFVLHELLGQQDVKNYDGSWTEYGSLVGVPIALGEEK